MRARVIRIGNSRGIRLPKAVLNQCNIDEMVELDVADGSITIRPVTATRAGWSDAARQMVERGEDGLLDSPTPTAFDETEWHWPED